MKIIRLVAAFVGLFAFMFNTTSCKKDDDNKCCTFTYSGQNVKVCEDDIKDYGVTWDEYKTYAEADGATCD